jgi:hypothetical protein
MISSNVRQLRLFVLQRRDTHVWKGGHRQGLGYSRHAGRHGEQFLVIAAMLPSNGKVISAMNEHSTASTQGGILAF